MAESVKNPKLKGSDIDTESAVQARRLQPGAQGVGKEADAIDESGKVIPEKLQQNQERLHQTPEHKTEEMDENNRGTFP